MREEESIFGTLESIEATCGDAHPSFRSEIVD